MKKENQQVSRTALASFMVQYNLLKVASGLTQEEIAKRVGTTQSSISRFERGEINPTYRFLEAISHAIGGSLVISPMADMTFTVPFGMQEKMNQIAELNNTTAKKILLEYTKSVFESEFLFSRDSIIEINKETSSFGVDDSGLAA